MWLKVAQEIAGKNEEVVLWRKGTVGQRWSTGMSTTTHVQSPARCQWVRSAQLLGGT